MIYFDLSFPLTEKIKSFPGLPAARIEQHYFLEKDGFNENLLLLYSHTATHVDAPAHILENGKTIDLFPIEKFFGQALVIDFSAEERIIDLNFLAPWQKKIKEVEFLLIRTGFAAHWADESYFEMFPVLSSEAAHFLSRLRLKGIGIDAPSFDPVESKDLINHRLLLGEEVLLYENLNLHPALPCEFKFFAFPLKIVKGDGSPLRAIGLIDQG